MAAKMSTKTHMASFQGLGLIYYTWKIAESVYIVRNEHIHHKYNKFACSVIWIICKFYQKLCKSPIFSHKWAGHDLRLKCKSITYVRWSHSTYVFMAQEHHKNKSLLGIIFVDNFYQIKWPPKWLPCVTQYQYDFENNT